MKMKVQVICVFFVFVLQGVLCQDVAMQVRNAIALQKKQVAELSKNKVQNPRNAAERECTNKITRAEDLVNGLSTDETKLTFIEYEQIANEYAAAERCIRERKKLNEKIARRRAEIETNSGLSPLRRAQYLGELENLSAFEIISGNELLDEFSFRYERQNGQLLNTHSSSASTPSHSTTSTPIATDDINKVLIDLHIFRPEIIGTVSAKSDDRKELDKLKDSVIQLLWQKGNKEPKYDDCEDESIFDYFLG